MTGAVAVARAALLAAPMHRHHDGHAAVAPLLDAVHLDPPLVPGRPDVLEVPADAVVASVWLATYGSRQELDLRIAEGDRGVGVESVDGFEKPRTGC